MNNTYNIPVWEKYALTVEEAVQVSINFVV